jgi:hypothetical protein
LVAHGRAGAGCREKHIWLANSIFCPTFVKDTLCRFDRGEKRFADLADIASAIDLIEAAYAASPLTPSSPCDRPG